MHEGRWGKGYAGAGGAELRGKTLGLVGLGRVGAEVSRRAQAGMGMRVIAHDPAYLAPERAKEWGVELVSVDDLLAQVGLRFPAHRAFASGDGKDAERTVHREDEASERGW